MTAHDDYMDPQSYTQEKPVKKIWFCKIGESDNVPHGGDAQMREAIATAYKALTGHKPEFIFSGWGGELTEPERAVVENRLPVESPQSAARSSDAPSAGRTSLTAHVAADALADAFDQQGYPGFGDQVRDLKRFIDDKPVASRDAESAIPTGINATGEGYECCGCWTPCRMPNCVPEKVVTTARRALDK